MRTKLLFTAIALAGCMAAMAQSNRFSAGLELAMPMGDYADQAGFGFGATLGFELPVGDKLGVFANAGYITFGKKEQDLIFVKVSTQQAMIPAQVGLKYYFNEAQTGFYAMAMVGIHSVSSTAKSSVTFLGQTIETESTASDVFLSAAPGVGYIVGENIDLSLRYQLIFAETTTADPTTGLTVTSSATNSYLGLRAAYMFGSR